MSEKNSPVSINMLPTGSCQLCQEDKQTGLKRVSAYRFFTSCATGWLHYYKPHTSTASSLYSYVHYEAEGQIRNQSEHSPLF